MSTKAIETWDMPIVIDERVRDDTKPISITELQQQLITAFQDYIAWRKLRLQVLKQKDSAEPFSLSHDEKRLRI